MPPNTSKLSTSIPDVQERSAVVPNVDSFLMPPERHFSHTFSGETPRKFPLPITKSYLSATKSYCSWRGTRKENGSLLSNNQTPDPSSTEVTFPLTENKPKSIGKRNHKLMKSKTESIGDTFVDGAVCLIEQSPYRIIKVAAKGDLQEFEKLYNVDHSRLHVQDLKGQGALHHAAAKGRTAIMGFIINQGGDINLRDHRGNSPLHTAVENKQAESIEFLLQNSADSSAKNEKQFTPLLLAIDLGHVDIAEVLLKRGVDPMGTGEFGATPLHHCAAKDLDECAKLLLAYGAKPCRKCNNGFYPIHIAAHNASSKALDVLIEYGESMGYTRKQMLSFADKECNNPLHSAVNSGDLKAVRVLLAAGAEVDAQQEDKSTPVHYAASQGALEMIELMYTMNPVAMAKAVVTKDSMGMTPIHRAAIFNHEPVVRCLLQNGADLDVQDNQQRTPLMVAAAKGGWPTARLLLQSGALINLRDQQNRNFLHLAIKSGARLHQFGCDLIKNIKDLLNEKDDLGCTPLHYASKEGYLSAIEDLIGLGAMLNPKNNQKQSPFHFAARYGRYNTCRRLLDSEQGVNIINESDGNGRSALHIAAENGHTKIISLLMQRGAAVHKDYEGNCPLHLAAANGYTQSMRLLLGVHSNLLNSTNREGDTPIHLAAKESQTSAMTLLLTLGAKLERNEEKLSFFDYILNSRNSEAAMATVTHDRWKEVMELCSCTYKCCFIGLIQQLPEIALVVLDRCQTYSEHERSHKKFNITYNFKYLQCPISYIREQKKLGNNLDPMMALNAMVKYGRVDCLSHPVCVNYLKMKWNAYGMWFHFINLGIYVIFLSLLTRFVTHYPPMYARWVNGTNTTTPTTEYGVHENSMEISTFSKATLYLILVFSLANMLKEIAQMIHQKRRYFMDHGNVMEWALYVTTAVFVVPFLAGHVYQWEAGALAVFLAWFNLLIYLQRFDFFGIYVVMFLEILSTLLQVLCVFSILIVAFGISFFMLLGQEASKAYSTPGLSLLRTAMMMLELDYVESFSAPYTDDDPNTLHFNNLTLFMLVLFVLLMPILLMNLLIGLAVGDIEAVQRDARLKRLAMQVEHHTDLENKMPQKILERVDKVEYTVYPNCGSHIMMGLLMKVTSVSEDVYTDDTGRSSHVTPIRLYEEMYKQKQRMKEMSCAMTKQTDLLRLIIQKMEINTEDDFRDEGTSTSDSLESLRAGVNGSLATGWRNPAIRANVVKGSAIISKWQKDAHRPK